MNSVQPASRTKANAAAIEVSPERAAIRRDGMRLRGAFDQLLSRSGRVYTCENFQARVVELPKGLTESELQGHLRNLNMLGEVTSTDNPRRFRVTNVALPVDVPMMDESEFDPDDLEDGS